MQIFISYSRGTPYLAESLKSLFESNQYQVWLDLDDIPAGEQWEQKINAGIVTSIAVVVIVTSQALDSEWIRKEIEIAKRLQINIIPVIMERLDYTDKALGTLGISHLQAINFVLTRKIQAEQQLLGAIQQIKIKSLSNAPYVEMLQAGDRDQQVFAIRNLAQLGNISVIRNILPFLEHSDSGVRYETVTALGIIGGDQAIPALINFIERRLVEIAEHNKYWSDELDIQYGILALGWIGSHKSVDFLLRLADEKTAFRMEIIWALAMISEGTTIIQLESLLKRSQHKTEEFFCIWALYKNGTSDAAIPIVDWLQQKLLKIEIVEDQYYVGDFDGNLYQLWQEIPHHYAQDFIHDEVINVVSAAAIILGLLKNSSARDVLLNMLIRTKHLDTHEDQYCAAVLGLGLLGDKSVSDNLRHQLDSMPIPSERERSPWEAHTKQEFIIEALRLLENGMSGK